MSDRISAPIEFNASSAKKVTLNTQKSLSQLSLMFTAQNSSFREDGVIYLKDGNKYLSEPIRLGDSPGKISLASFLLESELNSDKVYPTIDVVYCKGLTNAIWNLIFLEDKEPHEKQIKSQIFYPSNSKLNKVTFSPIKLFKGLICTLDVMDAFINKTIEMSFEVEIRGQTSIWKIPALLTNSHQTFRLSSPIHGLNVYVKSVTFSIEMGDTIYQADDFIQITFQEAY